MLQLIKTSTRRIASLALARNTEFFRDRGSMAWNFIFPFMVVCGFAFAYSGPPKPLYTVGVVTGAHSDTATAVRAVSGALAWQYVRYVPVADLPEDLKIAVSKVERHQLDLLLEPVSGGTGAATTTAGGGKYWVNSSSPKGYVLERMLAGLRGETWDRVPVEGSEVRYVDWLLPGIIGLNLTFSALFGVGYVIVRYRKNGVLKRLKATPLSAFEFLSSQVLSRLFIIGITTTVILVGCTWILKVPMRGSWLDLALILGLGAFCMISLGVLVASRVRSEELAGGLLNIVTWPMMFFSGIWFSLEGLNPTIQSLAAIFPLTHMLTAARAVMIDGASAWSQAPHFLMLAAVGVVSLVIGAWSFSWD